jgi:hypothetical protein
MDDIFKAATCSRRRALKVALAGLPAAMAADAAHSHPDADLDQLLAQWSRLSEHCESVARMLAEERSPPVPDELLYRNGLGGEQVIDEIQIEAIRRELAVRAGGERAEDFARAKLAALHAWRGQRDEAHSRLGQADAECMRIEQELEAIEKAIIDTPAKTARGITIKLALWRLHTGTARLTDRSSAFALSALADAERLE